MTAKTIKHYSDAKTAKASKRYSGAWRGCCLVWRRFNRSDRHETRRQLRNN